jgi:uncharacterized protein (UPF0212 family)
MIAASTQSLLRVWEAQQRAHPVQRALHLLADAWPEPGWEGWLHAPIGVRDGALMSLCESLFGSVLRTSTACPHCGERLESEFMVRELQSAPRASADGEDALSLNEHGWAIAYRLPTSDDLLQVCATPHNADDAARLLMCRCVSLAQRGAEAVGVEALPDDIVVALGAEMARHDPDADVQIELSCPACGKASTTHFDVVSYLLSEIDDWAQRVLADVHTLARAYGWSEDAILSIGPVRRQIYLDMVAA